MAVSTPPQGGTGAEGIGTTEAGREAGKSALDEVIRLGNDILASESTANGDDDLGDHDRLVPLFDEFEPPVDDVESGLKEFFRQKSGAKKEQLEAARRFHDGEVNAETFEAARDVTMDILVYNHGLFIQNQRGEFGLPDENQGQLEDHLLRARRRAVTAMVYVFTEADRMKVFDTVPKAEG